MYTTELAISEIKLHKGLDLQTILKEISELLFSVDLPNYMKLFIFQRMSELESWLNLGTAYPSAAQKAFSSPAWFRLSWNPDIFNDCFIIYHLKKFKISYSSHL